MYSSDGPTLLIVDDDSDVLNALTFMANTRGYRVIRCSAARDAIAVAEAAARLDCLIIDQGLPDHQGIDLLAILRNRGVAAPAVMITTTPSDTLRRRASAAGAAIVEKPLLDDALLSAVQSLMKG